MKLVLNKCYGGFGISKKFEQELGLKPYEYDMADPRTDERLIAAIEAGRTDINDEYSELKVVELPENTTDWYIDEYDGSESLIYVVDGLLHWA